MLILKGEIRKGFQNFNFSFSSNEDEHVFRITDDGDGFDWRDISKSIDANLEDRPFGKGIMLIKSFFDEVSWNDKGNEITMILKKGAKGA
jgi:anti-sigma regulatory factor (Ser/Thr protein kinase)